MLRIPIKQIPFKQISVRYFAFGPPKVPVHIPNSHSPEMLTKEDWIRIDENKRLEELYDLLDNPKQKLDSQDKDDLSEWFSICEKQHNNNKNKLRTLLKNINNDGQTMVELLDFITDPTQKFTSHECDELFDWHNSLKNTNSTAKKQSEKIQQVINNQVSKMNRIKERINV